MDNTAYVNTNVQDKIATVEFFHPEHNSLPSDLLSELSDAITTLGSNDEVLVIVLKSGGERTFCAGASFKELVSIEDESAGEVFFSGFANVINAMRKCPKFILGRVQGKIVGGGVGLAASVDYCMATQYASIKLSELSLGIGPFVVGPAVERKIGLSAVSQLAIDANSFYSADWARDKGLFTDVFQSTEDLDAAIFNLARNLCGYNPDAAKHMKQMFWRGTENWDELLTEQAKISGSLVLSSFTKEKLKRFK